jgi:DNA polymerase III subunit delta'
VNPAPAAPGPLLGNDAVRARLRVLARERRLHHCLLFEGPEGVGKATTARWLAAFLNCAAVLAPPGPALFGPAPPVDEPCGACPSCRLIARGEHPDVLHLGLDPEKTAPIIAVKQVRELVGALSLRPYLADRRLVIVDPADGLRQEGANALLKTLEEPPAATGFVLVSAAAGSLLPTVRSRSMRVRFAPVPLPALAGWLGARGLPDPGELARRAEGSPGRALRLAEDDGDAARALRGQLLAAIADGVGAMFQATEALADGERAEWSARAEGALRILSELLVDALTVDAGGSPRYHPDLGALSQGWADALGPRGVARLAARIEDAQADLDRFLNGRLLFDTLLAAFATELGPARRLGAAA